MGLWEDNEKEFNTIKNSIREHQLNQPLTLNDLLSIVNDLNEVFKKGLYIFGKQLFEDNTGADGAKHDKNDVSSSSSSSSTSTIRNHTDILNEIIYKYILFSKINDFHVNLKDGLRYNGIFEHYSPESVANYKISQIQEVVKPVEKLKSLELVNAIKILWINIALVELDDNLECNNNHKQRLETFSEILKDLLSDCGSQNINKKMVPFLQEKAKFLLYKVNKRNGTVQTDENIGAGTDTFGHFKRKINNKESDTTDIEDGDNATVEEIFNKCRWIRKQIKDAEKDNTAIDNSNKKKIDQFLNKKGSEIDQKIGENNEKEFNKYSWESLRIFFNNTDVRYTLYKEKNDFFKNYIDSLNKFSSDVYSGFISSIHTKIQNNNSNIKDFFPYFLLYNFLYSFVEYVDTKDDLIAILAVNDTIKDQDEQHQIDYLKETLKRVKNDVDFVKKNYEENLTFFRKARLNTIYLEYKDCYIEGSEIFLDSAYILPLNYEKIEQDIEKISELNQKLGYIQRIGETHIHKTCFEAELKETLKDVTKTKESIDKELANQKVDLEKKIKENEFKLVQITAMFVSIAVFVLSGVKIFEGKNVTQSLSVLLAFAASLLLFNAFFVWINRGFNFSRKEQNDIPIILLIVCFIGASIILNLIPSTEKHYFSKDVITTTSDSMIIKPNKDTLLKRTKKEVIQKIDTNKIK